MPNRENTTPRPYIEAQCLLYVGKENWNARTSILRTHVHNPTHCQHGSIDFNFKIHEQNI